jgi:hypothetical protein
MISDSMVTDMATAAQCRPIHSHNVTIDPTAGNISFSDAVAARLEDPPRVLKVAVQIKAAPAKNQAEGPPPIRRDR